MAYNPKKWQDYHQDYFRILDHFASTDTPALTYNLLYKHAVSRRHALYRFFRQLAADYQTDAYARRLSDIANNLSISITPGRARPETVVQMIIDRQAPFIPIGGWPSAQADKPQ